MHSISSYDLAPSMNFLYMCMYPVSFIPLCLFHIVFLMFLAFFSYLLPFNLVVYYSFPSRYVSAELGSKVSVI